MSQSSRKYLSALGHGYKKRHTIITAERCIALSDIPTPDGLICWSAEALDYSALELVHSLISYVALHY